LLMMGERTVMREALFYSFSIEDHVPTDHLLRSIDRFVELDGIREHLKAYYSEIGRPSIDPELMIRMLIIGYCMGIRSERRLCEEVHLNLAYRWFCGLSIEDRIPDHSAFSRARNERFREGDVFRRVFERVVEACIAAGLVGGEGFAVDASLIQADANKQRSIAGQDWRRDRDPARSSRAVLWPHTGFHVHTSRRPRREADRRLHHAGVGDRPDPHAPPHARVHGRARRRAAAGCKRRRPHARPRPARSASARRTPGCP